ncbi:MAG: hypothetical protein HYS32_03180 [Candidatus Woesearchaeota archaeon]|nr:MAG: hypothetical protein HYS32_03180 [Candidatus Woesearchaeota archaeon]
MKKILLILCIFLLSISTVSAVRFVDYDLREALFDDTATLITSTTPVTDVDVLGFECLDSTCSALGAQIFSLNSNTDVTPALDRVQATYPTALSVPNGYGVYYFKDGYIPWEEHNNFRGTVASDPAGPFISYLSKVDTCEAPIDSFTVLNDVQPNIPLVIQLEASLDSTVYSGIMSSGPLEAVPAGFEDQYSLETRVILTIVDQSGRVVDTQQQDVMIPFAGSKRIEFTYIPTQIGTYTVSVTTEAIDAKCLSSEINSVAKVFHVLDEVPQDMCYTLLNNIVLSDKFPTEGKTLRITGEKTSNHADQFSQLTPVETRVNYDVFGPTGLVTSSTFLLPANPDNFNPQAFAFDVPLPATSGLYDVQITAVAESPLCNGLPNLAETIDQTFIVTPKPATAPTLSKLPDLFLIEGDPAQNDVIDLRAFVSDPDTPIASLTFSILSQSNPLLISCSVDQNRFIDCTAPVGSGAAYVTVRVTDGLYNDFDTFVVVVDPLAVNNAPYIFSTPKTSALANVDYFYQVKAADPDGDSLTFSLAKAPTGMTIDPVTGLIAFTPSTEDEGEEFPVAVQVSDGSLTGLQFYILEVSEFPHKFEVTGFDLSDFEVQPGQELWVFSAVSNKGVKKENDIRVQAVLPELSIYSEIFTFDLGRVETKWSSFPVVIPSNAPDGEYLIIIRAYNEDFTYTKYASVEVKN